MFNPVHLYLRKGQCVVQKTKKKTLHPQWNEDLHMLVQEPKTQVMRCQVYDWDGINVKVLFTGCTLAVLTGGRGHAC